MTENKKDKSNDSVKQLGAYKNSKFAELSSNISREKSRAAELLNSIYAKKELLNAKTDEVFETPVVKAEKIEEKSVKKEADVIVLEEKPKKVIKEVEVELPKAEKKVDEKKSTIIANKKVEKTEESPKIENKVEKKEDKVEKKEDKPLEKVEKSTPKSEAEAPPKKKTEENPFGERRIYVPPAPTKPTIKTRVFDITPGQNRGPRQNNQGGGYNNQGGGYRPNNGPSGGYNNQGTGFRPNNAGGGYNNQGGGYRPNNGPSGGYNNQGTGFRPNNGQGAPGAYGQNRGPQTGQQRPFRPMGAPTVAPNFTPQRNLNQKGKPGQTTGRHDERKAMNKRDLLKKGYIVDDKIALGDEDVRIRNFKNRNKNSLNGNIIIIENAIIATNPVSIKVLSEKIGKAGAEIIKTLFFLGIVKTINESIDFDTAELVAGEYNITLEYKPEATFEDTLVAKRVSNDEEDNSKLVSRSPIVTIMGHVDHGKTSLLDYIRKANVTSGEAGGITQHIGAYTKSLNGSQITFLDTPGHEAFTSMRARGAQVTDIAILVVAADDGIMPQTIEAINHSKQAKVSIIVAVNKMDREGANPDRILTQLSEHNILPEEWGGDTPVIRVSAKTGFGVDTLLENILLLAEMRELKANPNRNARGTIIEARMDKGLGKIATILVQTGTLKLGDYVIAGTATGKIRTMIDDKGNKIKEAGPSTPVFVTGWDNVPEAGELIDVVENEKFARELAEERILKIQAKNAEAGVLSLTDLFDKIKKGELKSVKLIIKADVQGSVEALVQALKKEANEEVEIEIIHSAVGAVNEGDVSLAETAKAIIIAFNVRPESKARILAVQKKIDIKFYNIIYDVIEDVQKAVKGLLEPKFKEVILGSAEVRELFRISTIGVIAGSHVIDGKVTRGAKCRLIRNSIVEYTGEISSLRHGKEDVKEMSKNFDCGITLQNYQDVKNGDIIEAFKMEQIDE